MPAVMVHVSHAYKNMDMTMERISLILELMAMFLKKQLSQNNPSFVFAVTCCDTERSKLRSRDW